MPNGVSSFLVYIVKTAFSAPALKAHPELEKAP